MFRIDVPSAATTLPTPAAAGTPGYFTDGNPGTGSAPTIVEADWLNMVQEELINAVLGSGQTPSKTNHSQLQNILVAKFQSINAILVNTPGSASYTPTANMLYALVFCQGAGGGGGGGMSTTYAGGAGGSAGGCGIGLYPLATIGSGAISLTIGTGGTGGAYGGSGGGGTGGNGGSTSFGSFITATGGQGGGGGAPSYASVPFAGGGSSGALLNINGGGGNAGKCTNALDTYTFAGSGGASFFAGSGAPGVESSGAGFGGSNGGGGGGAIANNPGGNGGNGLIYILEFIG